MRTKHRLGRFFGGMIAVVAGVLLVGSPAMAFIELDIAARNLCNSVDISGNDSGQVAYDGSAAVNRSTNPANITCTIPMPYNGTNIRKISVWARDMLTTAGISNCTIKGYDEGGNLAVTSPVASTSALTSGSIEIFNAYEVNNIVYTTTVTCTFPAKGSGNNMMFASGFVTFQAVSDP